MRRADELKTLLKTAAAGGQGPSADTNRDIGRNTNLIPLNYSVCNAIKVGVFCPCDCLATP